MELIQMKNAIVETKNSVDRLNNRSDTAEELTGKNLEKLPKIKCRKTRRKKT